MLEACYLLHGKHIGPSRERSETGCFIEPVPRGSREPSRGSSLRFFDSFGTSIGIHFVFMKPSIFGSFFGCVSEAAVDKLYRRGAGVRGSRLGRGIPFQEIPGAD